MTPSVHSAARQFAALPLTGEHFRPFGSVISATVSSDGAEPANQGTAVKIQGICPTVSMYDLAPSKIPAKPTTSLFICSPRELRQQVGTSAALFDVKILERHPYTTQTFVPLGLDRQNDAVASYLVIVCPSLHTSARSSESATTRSYLQQDLNSQDPHSPALHNPPDLEKLKAFIAHGSQAVSYAAGTWHAPMVVLGKDAVDFVVFQSVNGVSDEDCQEVNILPQNGLGEGVAVRIPMSRESAKL